MKILLTGGSGFLGRRIHKVATAGGHEVLGLTRPHHLGDPNWTEIRAFRPETCIHAAWYAKPGHYLNAPENETLLRDSLIFLRQLGDEGVARFVALGTCLEYAPSNSPLEEDRSAIEGRSRYARAKISLHTSFAEHARENGLDVCWARVFFPYGEGEDPKKICTQIIRSLKAGESFEIKHPQSVRDYIHADDVADAIVHLASGQMNGTFNIGTGEHVTMQALAETIARHLDRSGGLRYPAVLPVDEFPSIVPSMAKLFAEGWRPKISLDEGLRRLEATVTS